MNTRSCNAGAKLYIAAALICNRKVISCLLQNRAIVLPIHFITLDDVTIHIVNALRRILFYSSSFRQASKLNPGQHKSRPGLRSILLPPRAAALPRLDVGSGGV